MRLMVRQDPMRKVVLGRPYIINGVWHIVDAVAPGDEYMVDGGWLNPASVSVSLHEITKTEANEAFERLYGRADLNKPPPTPPRWWEFWR